jgi:hypothetical protein
MIYLLLYLFTYLFNSQVSINNSVNLFLCFATAKQGQLHPDANNSFWFVL